MKISHRLLLVTLFLLFVSIFQNPFRVLAGDVPPTLPGDDWIAFFPGDQNDQDTTPPDPVIAVGPSDAILMTNENIRSFNKVNPTLNTLDISLAHFFGGLSATNGDFFDPYMKYDKFLDRWYAVALESSEPYPSITTKLKFAYTRNKAFFPLNEWTVLNDISKNVPQNCFIDHPNMGVDRNASIHRVDDFLPQ